ncbi:alpha/beta hydrolase [Speluncibacter jeojiensis]|uniref:Alpha/beta hydrolase n=1 Tax=Speluncibacter jeojiensis TaxID=2710754 RepID=A0A9X4M171_9ACTN|nr:alpha/beta hydrolase [Corynebacteriales bacterium D3-21]
MIPRPLAQRRTAAIVVTLAALTAGGLGACAASSDTATTTEQSAASAGSLHMIANEGHRLAFHVIPGHRPAIVLDAGGGLDSSQWHAIAPALAQRTGSEVITYDRAGEGASDEVPGPWKAANAASDLRAGLTALGARGAVLVSHSLAGEVATELVRSDPDRVAGAVLVDASLPEFYTDAETARIVAANAHQIAELRGKPQTRQTRQLLAQAADYGPAHRAYHRMSWPDIVPATVIVSSQTPFDTPQDARLWKAAQAQFAGAASNRTLIHADPSSHDIPEDRPDVVMKAVEDMVARVRADR